MPDWEILLWKLIKQFTKLEGKTPMKFFLMPLSTNSAKKHTIVLFEIPPSVLTTKYL